MARLTLSSGFRGLGDRLGESMGGRGDRRAYEFGIFRLEVAERQLLRHGQPVSLTPKAFDLLVYFVEHRKTLLTKDTLLLSRYRGDSLNE